MRFSDLRKMKEEPPAAKERPRRETPRPAVEPAAQELRGKQIPAPPKPDTAAAPEEPAPPGPEPARRTHTTPPPGPPFEEQRAQAREKYSLLMQDTTSFLKAVDRPYTEKYQSVLGVCAMTAETLKTNSAFLSCVTYGTADDYLRAHTANTVILALAMGLEAGLPEEELGLLGFCAMSHDIGMTGYSDLYSEPGRLTESERAELSLHVEAGAAKLERVVDLDYKVKDRAIKIVLQAHWRPDGTGYPVPADDGEADPLAQIIAIADAYEAMTHQRSWRQPLPPSEVVKELIEKEGHGFNARGVKLLISAVSIFPPGSIVQLSNGETALVLKTNRGLLAKPLLEILLRSDFSESAHELADLKDHPLISIEHSISLEELSRRNPKCAGRLEVSRWWTDW